MWCADLKSLYAIADTTGLDDATADFAKVIHGHLFHTPSREGLAATHRGELRTLLSSPGQDDREAILAWVKKYSRLTTYEISIPSLWDSGLSPEGRTGKIASFLLEYDLVRRVSDQGWYEEFKIQVEDAMIEVLDSSVFPALKERIVLRLSSSPTTIENKFSNSEGGITGWYAYDAIHKRRAARKDRG